MSLIYRTVLAALVAVAVALLSLATFAGLLMAGAARVVTLDQTRHLSRRGAVAHARGGTGAARTRAPCRDLGRGENPDRRLGDDVRPRHDLFVGPCAVFGSLDNEAVIAFSKRHDDDIVREGAQGDIRSAGGTRPSRTR